MATLGIHKDFLRDLVKLERPVQKKVVEALDKFEKATHAGAHLEKLDDVLDERLKSIRIDQSYRGIVLAPQNGDHFLLLKVMHHDPAYAWARRRRVSINTANGELEIRDVAMIEEATSTGLATAALAEADLLFSHVSDADLTRLGVDDQIRRFARLVTTPEQLETLVGYLPQSQYDVLIGLAAGYSVDEVWDQVVESPIEEIDPDDLVAAAERMPTKVALVRGSDELMALLDKPFAYWRVYLHPTQYEVAHVPYGGPAQVIGGPGTGKTVVALHRARNLARNGGRVLLTTFTSTLADSLKENLLLLEPDPEVIARIDVRTVDAVAHRVVFDHAGRFPILKDTEERDAWRRIVRRRKVDFNETFIAEEWRQVILAQGLTALDDYLKARRTGRGRRLGPLQRTQIWRTVEEFTAELAARRHHTYETVCVKATRLMAVTPNKPYDHVIVDEAQDLHPVRWRLLRALVAHGANDLFIAADTHQRIYDNRVSLKSVDVHVAGRTTRLTINYRTTAEILSWSHRILSDVEITDLDDTATTLTGFRSEMHGEVPETIDASTRQEELALLASKVGSWLASGVRPSEIGVAARSGPLAQEAVTTLAKAGIPAHHVGRKHTSPSDHVQAMTMHRMKGLEFRCVAIIGASDHLLPDSASLRPAEYDDLAHQHDLQRERCLLFVACTRAREALYLSWHGTPTSFLPPSL
ncbi:3'-5' exonuclease [Actinocorallia libanotica]|uniref:DNA 3'-5' helicase n=1 Tax=Actinocorallia libanotica TaxID=46162 RepID=A0ABN1R8W6_9ACTN